MLATLMYFAIPAENIRSIKKAVNNCHCEESLSNHEKYWAPNM